MALPKQVPPILTATRHKVDTEKLLLSLDSQTSIAIIVTKGSGEGQLKVTVLASSVTTSIPLLSQTKSMPEQQNGPIAAAISSGGVLGT